MIVMFLQHMPQVPAQTLPKTMCHFYPNPSVFMFYFLWAIDTVIYAPALLPAYFIRVTEGNSDKHTCLQNWYKLRRK
jgi:hypothetical protein